MLLSDLIIALNDLFQNFGENIVFVFVDIDTLELRHSLEILPHLKREKKKGVTKSQILFQLLKEMN
jgi:hypothetical protein